MVVTEIILYDLLLNVPALTCSLRCETAVGEWKISAEV